jgi:hypothetical protein
MGPHKIPFMPLPLFILVRVCAPFTKKRFGLFGPRVMPGLFFEGVKSMALQVGAILGRARPDFVEAVVKSYSDRPSDSERVRFQRDALAGTAEGLLAGAGHPETFDDLAGFDESIAHAGVWIDVREALPGLVQYLLVGLELGVRKPQLTRSLVDNEVKDRSGVRKALLESGLKLPEGRPFERYAEWEQYVLSEVDEWRRTWGGRADEWQRTLG